MKVLNCGYIYRVALDTKVCTYGMYIWYLSLLLSLYAYLSLVGMGCNEFACRYTNHECVA